MSKIPVIFVGLGPVGLAAMQAATRVPRIQIVGGVDPAPALSGKRLHEIAGVVHAVLPEVLRRVEDLPKDLPAGTVAILATSSRFRDVEPVLRSLAQRKISVVSSCEPLAHAPSADPDFAERVNSLCKEQGVAVVGTGVNPGLAMDCLPALLLRGSLHVRRVEIVRHFDLTKRRKQLQDKVGVGLTRDEFRRREEEGGLGHQGLEQSARLVAEAAGWQLDPFEMMLTPLFDGNHCVGLRHEIDATFGGEPRIRMELLMKMNLISSYDEITIDGTPPVNCRIEGGLKGEEVTLAAMLNTTLRIHRMPPGLHSTLEIPL